MAHDIRWYVKGRVLYVNLRGTVPLEEGQHVNEQAIQMLNTGTPLVHTILDSSRLEKIPTSLSQIQKTTQVYRHPAMGWIVEVGSPNAFIRFVSYTIAQLFRVRYHRVATLNEALAFLKDQDTTVNWAESDASVLHGVTGSVGEGA